MSRFFSFTMDIKVTDAKHLRERALRHLVEVDGLEPDEAEAHLGDKRNVDVATCLVALLDPGYFNAGAEILSSEAELLNEDPDQVCGSCGAEVSYLIGCPDGLEICTDCFEQGKG